MSWCKWKNNGLQKKKTWNSNRQNKLPRCRNLTDPRDRLTPQLAEPPQYGGPLLAAVGRQREMAAALLSPSISLVATALQMRLELWGLVLSQELDTCQGLELTEGWHSTVGSTEQVASLGNSDSALSLPLPVLHSCQCCCSYGCAAGAKTVPPRTENCTLWPLLLQNSLWNSFWLWNAAWVAAVAKRQEGREARDKRGPRVKPTNRRTQLGWLWLLKGNSNPLNAMQFHFWLQGLEETVIFLTTDR